MKCTSMKKDGEQCQAFAMKWLDCCYLHNPAISIEEKKDAQSKWGKVWMSMNNLSLHPIDVSEANDVTQLLIETINQVRAWTIDVKTANCIWFLCNSLTKVYQHVQIKTDIMKTDMKLLKESDLLD
jgi:hypothetical protein